MRMRNKPWAIDFLKSYPELMVFEPHLYKGKWSSLLNKKNICLEIGSGKGDYFTTMSKLYPENGWIAVEKDKNVTVIAVKKILEKNEIDKNVRIIQNDASNISDWFDNGEIDSIYLNFSDPWHKKRYFKRRLTSETFIEQYHKILKKNGRIIMKTDNQDLFEWSIIQFSNLGWIIEDVSVDYHSQLPDDVMTEYEEKFVSEGKRIYRVIFKKV